MWERIGTGIKRARRRVPILSSTIAVALILGITLLALSSWPHWNSILQVAGAALIVASLSIASTTITSREVSKRQNTRDASLKAKTEAYEPLYVELKGSRRILEVTQHGDSPYAPEIIVRSDDPALTGASAHAERYAKLHQWGDFKRDTRDLYFRPRTAQDLDALVQRARAYNDALAKAREATLVVLPRYVEAARQQTMQATTKEGIHPFLTYQLQHRARQMNPATAAAEEIENRWFEILEVENASDLLAAEWIKGIGGFYSRPETLGWLLNKRPDRAADAVIRIYPQSVPAAAMPSGWVQAIFASALPELTERADYPAVWKASSALLRQVTHLDNQLEAALRSIREEYEGPPRV